MPVSEEKARLIYDETMAFFRTGGSANQVYPAAAVKRETKHVQAAMEPVDTALFERQQTAIADNIPLTDQFQMMRDGNKARDDITSIISDYLSPMGLRNEQASAALESVSDLRDELEGKTILEYGQMLHGRKVVYGNCQEHACVAAFLAEQESVPVDEIFLVAALPPGDHGFCYVGQRPGFTNVQSMATTTAGWVIDPWAGIVGPPNKYAETITQTAATWQERGQRIGQVGESERTWKDSKTWVDDLVGANLRIYDARYKFKFS